MEQTILLVMHKKGQSPAALLTAHLLSQVNGSLKEEGMLFFSVTNMKRCWCESKKISKTLPVFTKGLFTATFQSKATLQRTRLARIKPRVCLIFLRAGRQPRAEGTAVLSPYLSGLVDVPANDVSNVVVLLCLEIHSGGGFFL